MVDQDMISDFVEESSELLESIEKFFLDLEKSDDPEKVNSIFRAVHTIKGTSGFLGLEKIGTLSHTMENLMSKIRDKELKPDSVIIDALLQGNDLLKEMIADVSSCDNVNIEDVMKSLENTLSAKSREVASEPVAISSIEKQDESKTSKSFNENDEIVKEFLFEAGKYLENLEEILDEWDIKDYCSPASVEKGLHALNAIKGSSSFAGFSSIGKMAEFGEKCFSEIRVNPNLFSRFLKPLFSLKDKMQLFLDNFDNINETEVHEFIKNLSESITTDPVKKTEPSDANIKSENINTEVEKNEKKYDSTKTESEKSDSIRIHLNLIDRLMRLAGELVLIRNQQLRSFQDQNSAFREITQRLDGVTTEIQETIMKTRLQPLGIIVNKFPRIVRELNKSLNKKIEIQINGADVELDKTIIESLAAPLTHIIRNSADHGIEMPEERKRKNKAEKGVITINAYHEGGLIHIQIIDDGKGMDLEKIREKALEKKIVSKNELSGWSENEIINLVMQPGFSTAESVSAVSGRGVGMDVVKSTIEKLNGSIEIKSKSDKGSEVLIKLPLTLAIIPSLIVASGGYRYAIPQVNLEELVTISNEDGKKIEKAGNQELYQLRDYLLPIVRLDELLKNEKKFTNEKKIELISEHIKRDSQDPLNLAVLLAGNKKYGLIIDRVIGTEEIVVKPMHSSLSQLKIYSGATILGDGKIALILDAEGIGNHFGINYNIKKNQDVLDEDTINESILIFRYGKKEQFGISLHLIQRIQEISASDIQLVGESEYVHFDDKSIKIIRMDKFLDIDELKDSQNYYILLFKHINKPAGIIISELIDIREISILLDEVSYKKPGVLGTDVINDKITVFPDIYRIMEMAEPEWFSAKDNANLYVGKKILLVDDSSIFRSMISKYLIEEKFEVDTAVEGRDALNKLKNNHYDMLISDLEMPIMDGFNLINEVRNLSENSDIPAIALSSLNKPDIIDRAIHAGFNRYEIKIERDHFINVVYNLMEQIYG